SLQFDPTGRWLSVDATEATARVLEFADASECRSLAGEPFSDGDRFAGIAIDRTGRHLVAPGNSVVVWDLPRAETLARLPVGYSRYLVFDARGSIVTGSPMLLKWPVHEAPSGETTIGPPQRLSPLGTGHSIAIGRDGTTIAAAMGDGGLVV